MKALLLAAGLGTRLRPLTDTITKCMLPIGGRPQLSYWLDLLSAHGVTDVLVNTHHLAEQVRAYVAGRSGLPAVTLVHEDVLLGSAGTLAHNRRFFEGEGRFFIAYADTLTNVDLSAMRDAHEASGRPVSIALFRTPDPSACGIVTLDETDTVIGFEEKPKHPRSDLAFGGVILTDETIFDMLPDVTPSDIGGQVLPKLVNRLHGWRIGDAYLKDIGTHSSYEAVQRDIGQVQFPGGVV